MNEEEKKAIEHLNSFLNIPEYVWIKESELLMVNIKIVLNLIEKQQKELNSLKEIEQLHKEENGKLRVELEQEKEKNKENIKCIEEWINGERVSINCISKDKIKEKIEDYEKMVEGTFKDNTWYGQNRRDNCYEIIRILNELLEEN